MQAGRHFFLFRAMGGILSFRASPNSLTISATFQLSQEFPIVSVLIVVDVTPTTQTQSPDYWAILYKKAFLLSMTSWIMN